MFIDLLKDPFSYSSRSNTYPFVNTILVRYNSMAPLAVTSFSSLERLPVEILQTVMASLDEAASLPSLLASCSTLFYAFKDAENLIVERIVARELGPGILPEAIARLETAFSSKRLPPGNLDELAKKHLTERKQPSTVFTLRQAVVLSRFHFFVDSFTSDYISKTLVMWPQDFHPNRRSALPYTARVLPV